YQFFRHTMDAHFAAEEERLFPAFEQVTGTSAGPTAVMRAEHESMRALMNYMGGAVIARDFIGYGEEALLLHELLTQHSVKEEHILYVLCDEHLPEAQRKLLSDSPD